MNGSIYIINRCLSALVSLICLLWLSACGSKPPTVELDPTTITVKSGESVTLQAITSDPGVTYQWTLDEGDGELSDKQDRPAIVYTAPDNGSGTAIVSVTVSNAGGATIKSVAILMETSDLPVIASNSPCPGGPVSDEPQTMPFYVFENWDSSRNHFCPSGFMGDVGDVTLEQGDVITFTYRLVGNGPSACNYGSPCKWAGVYWMNPEQGTWASQPGHGYNLSRAEQLVFRARSLEGAVVEFKVGGITGNYPDSLFPPPSTGPVKLMAEWQEYTIPISGNARYVIGGFLWAANWESNPGKEEITFELDDIRYE